MSIEYGQEQMERRVVRYGELKACTTAFIDTRTPGSEKKENFTIIGPGVAENPDQFVHIDIPHGFNIGAARQPPRCVNSQHSHETAEVFLVHSGLWRFMTGECGADGYVDLRPGDAISIPTHVFRGFENIGDDVGFMFAVLGGDDPGRVLWAPYVFEAARAHGLVLLENGRLIDTRHESVPPDVPVMRPTAAADVAKLDRYDSDAIARCVLRAAEMTAGGGLSRLTGFAECPVIGTANAAEDMPAGRMDWSHGFQVRALAVDVGASTPRHSRLEEEVLLMHQGTLRFSWDRGSLTLGPGDTLTIPKGLARIYANEGDERVITYVVRGGDHPRPAQWSDEPPSKSRNMT
jgi:mannose-6-phosphate isomerase-like protein (cupin superfamily)